MSGGPYVSVVGSGAASGELYEKARQIGRLVAEGGGTVICGGRSGVMEAAARGATEAGGVAIGILPNEDRRQANEFLTFSIATGAGHARNLAVVCSGEVVIAVGAGYGTLSEVGLALKVGRPVVALRSWELGEHVSVASTPEEATERAFDLLGM